MLLLTVISVRKQSCHTVVQRSNLSTARCSLAPDLVPQKVKKVGKNEGNTKANDNRSQESQYTHNPLLFSGRRKRRRSTISTLLTTWELTTDERSCIVREREIGRGGVTYPSRPQFVDHIVEVEEAGPRRAKERSISCFWLAALCTWEGAYKLIYASVDVAHASGMMRKRELPASFWKYPGGLCTASSA